ncbi:hyaluronidase-2-like [Carcharodon carcharias]|uniref:hyaluronidase-2-like n=1 Tax=Carcharodon carcharias TaxID=13397 RepID=UPI001B7E6075|nr:hyaluronidase-2-like [Carcharodon carcharias]XP_041048646.1 hyaluronidase-2-like [Carcharodon carcharias]XP_041048647.1 hyaluronidase-2-like [Carcharodon carcharias]XP_041048648.1 hyaluronidase-2-like [Carcharodon carcharias]
MAQRSGSFARVLVFVVTLLVSKSRAQLKQTSRFGNKPFVTVWNAPTQDCVRHSVNLNLNMFDIISSPNEGFYDQNLTIFYKERLGRYPYYHGQQAVNGGVPQNSSLMDHLTVMERDIERYMRSRSTKGLAVIDWEEWRPLWIRNWKDKQIYRNSSRRLVSERHPDWTESDLNREAQFEFEQSAQRFMAETLRRARNSRPHSMWGFYLFPDCYNHDYKNNMANYTGRCPDVEISRNDLLRWLWTNSTAVFPSIYLDAMLRSTNSATKFVRSRVKEALRVSELHSANYSLPVFVYSRPTYTYTVDLLTERDLITTIGETAALGAAGIIFWGDADYSNSESHCKMLKNYLEGDFGRYVLNVTTATQHCSQALCQGHGRCERRDSQSDAYLHLSADSFQIQGKNVTGGTKLVLTGALTKKDISQFQERFQCRCYRGWMGQHCNIKTSGAQLTLPHVITLILTLLLSLII